MANILVVDDEESICFAFSQCIRQMGHTPFSASNTKDAWSLLEQVNPAILFLDVRLPGESGINLLEKIQKSSHDPAVIVITAFGTMDTAIEAVRKGAYEYLKKPVDLEEVQTLIINILDPGDTDVLAVDEEPDMGRDAIIGTTDAISGIYKMIGRLTTNDVPVLIEGESGVGKELVARAIHNRSERKSFPFVAINCGAMPENLLESELFGHEKGAFTGADTTKVGKFEYAGNGTIFLDEIGDLKFSLQVKLLRVLQEKAIVRVGGLKSIPVGDARVITATNKNLQEEMNAGRFRSDLYYRLQLITLKIPPLRQRKGDIPALVSHFIRKGNRELGLHIRGISNSAMSLLMEHDWPGNVRELENVVKRGLILSRTEILGPRGIELTGEQGRVDVRNITDEDIERQIAGWFEARKKLAQKDDRLHSSLVALAEKTLIRRALEFCENNQLKTSELLGMNRTTLRNKIKEFGL